MHNSIFSDERFDILIKNRIENFWGYGNLDGNVWFIGMEEGCDHENPKLFSRFEETSGGEVFDIFDDMKGDEQHQKWFKEGAPTQSTYRKLIYLLISLETGSEPKIEDIREYQAKRFGRKTEQHAALELMPLPCPSIRKKDWLYGASKVEGLGTRRDYLDRYMEERIKRLKELAQEHRPRLVICYSMTYLKRWQKITDVPFDEILTKKLLIATEGNTTFAIIPHSVARSMSNVDWKNIAEKLAPYYSA